MDFLKKQLSEKLNFFTIKNSDNKLSACILTGTLILKNKKHGSAAT